MAKAGSALRTFGRWLARGLLALVALVLVLLALSALSNVGLPSGSEDPATLSMAEQARLAETIHLRETLGDSVWPGWADAAPPQIVYNEAYAFLVDFEDPPPPGWYREPAHEHRGGPWTVLADVEIGGRPVYRTALPEGVSPEAFAVRVGERWVGSVPTLEWARLSLRAEIADAVPPPLSWIPPYRLLGPLFFRGHAHHVALTLHENFHAYQGQRLPARFARAEELNRLEDAYPEDPAMKAAWEAELEALAAAVESESPEEATRLARQFLDLRSDRHQGMDAELIAFEVEREWLEGLAKYVELRSWLVAHRTGTYAPLERAQALGAPADYADAEEAFEREIGQLRRSAGQGGTLFYYSGMAQALLLDRLAPGWKAAAFSDSASLHGLLTSAGTR